MGSPAYMAPEQRRGKDTTPRTDVHALALVACEMVTGRLPGEGGGLDGVPARWLVPLRRALEAEPERRPADPRELVASLGSGPRWRSRRWVALLLALVVLGGPGCSSVDRDEARGERRAPFDRRALAGQPGKRAGGRLLRRRARGGHPDPADQDPRPACDLQGLNGAIQGHEDFAPGDCRRAGRGGRSAGERAPRRRQGADHRPAGRRCQRGTTLGRDLRPGCSQRPRCAERRGIEGCSGSGGPPYPSRASETPTRRDHRPQAYDAYLRGLSKVERVWSFESANTLANALEAAEASAADFERAVALDPNYATAHARLGIGLPRPRTVPRRE